MARWALCDTEWGNKFIKNSVEFEKKALDVIRWKVKWKIQKQIYTQQHTCLVVRIPQI